MLTLAFLCRCVNGHLLLLLCDLDLIVVGSS